MNQNDASANEALRKAVRSAISDNAIEGIELSTESLAILERVANGEISTEVARQTMKETIEGWMRDYPERFWEGEIIADPNDPYVYAGTNVLINKFGIIDPECLKEVEGFFVATRLIELRLTF